MGRKAECGRERQRGVRKRVVGQKMGEHRAMRGGRGSKGEGGEAQTFQLGI